MELENVKDISPYRHPKLQPILMYVQSGKIVDDLKSFIGNLKNEQLVCWKVLGVGEEPACWRDESLFQSFIDYYQNNVQKRKSLLCMISGKFMPPATQHLKGVIPNYGNAKLISSNDEKDFTYRGRWKEDWQAASISYESSQKAHNALHWMVVEQGVRFGDSTFLCWNPQGKLKISPASSFLSKNEKPTVTMSDYKEQLKNTLLSTRKENQLTGNEPVVLAALDAATKGRLSLTYYGEFPMDTFLQRMCQWDEDCCWKYHQFGIQSPSLYQMVNHAFGTERKEGQENFEMKTDEKVMKFQMWRLIACKVKGDQRIPVDIVRALTQRASNPQAYQHCWQDILFTACAVLRKYRKDQYKEEWSVALDEKNTNRSYLFGRLLAIAEKVERDTYKEEKREPNAIRMQSVFSRRPLYTWRILEEKLVPYYQKLFVGQRKNYRKLTAEIFARFQVDDVALNQPLEDIYLLGYYHQRQALYTKKNALNDIESEGEE